MELQPQNRFNRARNWKVYEHKTSCTAKRALEHLDFGEDPMRTTIIIDLPTISIHMGFKNS